MPVQKYDIRRPEKAGSGFEERYWSPINAPVFGPDRQLAYIIHRVEDVTEFILQKEKGDLQEKVTEELRHARKSTLPRSSAWSASPSNPWRRNGRSVMPSMRCRR